MNSNAIINQTIENLTDDIKDLCCCGNCYKQISECDKDKFNKKGYYDDWIFQ
jgi:hypothetical protein